MIFRLEQSTGAVSARVAPSLRVQVSVVDDARAVVFLALEQASSPAAKERLANEITRRLRAAGLLASGLEQHYSAADAARLLGDRSAAWAVKHAKLGDFGPVVCDGGNWLIPASGLLKYLDEHRLEVA